MNQLDDEQKQASVMLLLACFVICAISWVDVQDVFRQANFYQSCLLWIELHFDAAGQTIPNGFIKISLIVASCIAWNRKMFDDWIAYIIANFTVLKKRLNNLGRLTKNDRAQETGTKLKQAFAEHFMKLNDRLSWISNSFGKVLKVAVC